MSKDTGGNLNEGLKDDIKNFANQTLGAIAQLM